MRLPNFCLLLITISIVCFSSCDRNKDFQVTVYTEDYAPFNYLEGNDIVGSSADLVYSVMSNNQEENAIKIVSWNEGYTQLQQDDHAALFTIDMTSERKDLFKWAGPISTIDIDFFGKIDAGRTINSLEEAKELTTVGVPENYYQHELLQSYGFTNLVLFQDVNTMMDALYTDEIEVVVESIQTITNTLEGTAYNINELGSLYTLQTYLGYIGFNKNVPDETVDSWQNTINQMKKNGYLSSLYQQYQPSIDAPGTYQVYTEQNAPQNFLNAQNNLDGSAIDIVKEIYKVIDYDEPIKITHWENAWNILDINPNTVLFSMVRTPERENQFEWVGPICKDRTYFYTLLESGLTIESLADAKVLTSVGVVENWVYQGMLEDEGFENLELFDSQEALYTALINAEIECAVFPDISIPYTSELTGLPYNNLVAQFEWVQNEVYIAFSKDSDPTLVASWQDAFSEIQQNGLFDIIWNKWYPNILPPM